MTLSYRDPRCNIAPVNTKAGTHYLQGGMQAVDNGDFGYLVETISNRAGGVIYRYTVYQRAPKEQQLLYGFEPTWEEAERIAARYTQIASGACKACPVS